MKQMPIGTILFKTADGSAVAYEYSYFKNHFPAGSGTYEQVYYKAGYNRDSWINYKLAIQCKTGTKDERIRAALADPDFLIPVEMIPACYYNSSAGRTYYAPYDGYYDNEMWLERNDMDLNVNAVNESLINSSNRAEMSSLIKYRWDGEDLIVTFPRGVRNAIISLNMMFYHYEVAEDDRKIIYRNIKSYISAYKGFEEEDKIYDLKFNVYMWDKLVLDEIVTPVSIDTDLNAIVLKDNLEENAFIFYNGIMYTYKISEMNSKYVTINGLDVTDNINIDRIYIHKMRTNDPEMEAKIYLHRGVVNRYKDSVDFLLPICNSLIVYNGIDHEYSVEDDNAIKYDKTIYSLYDSPSYLSDAISVNFMKG